MKKPSTKSLEFLPRKEELQRICKSISALEAIICPEWQYRYYSYNKEWSDTEEFCEMRTGTGDQMLILFSPDGVAINGFAHESSMNGWRVEKQESKQSFLQKIIGSKKQTPSTRMQKITKGVVESLPEVFNEFIFGEPIKSIGTTFCIWSTTQDCAWVIGDVQFPNDKYGDGSEDLLQLLDGNPSTYIEWAQEYYEEEFENRTLDSNVVEKVYRGATITKEMIDSINPDLEDLDKLRVDLTEIGINYDV